MPWQQLYKDLFQPISITSTKEMKEATSPKAHASMPTTMMTTSRNLVVINDDDDDDDDDDYDDDDDATESSDNSTHKMIT